MSTDTVSTDAVSTDSTDPVVESNLMPADATVECTLSEDTISHAGALDIADGSLSVAVFENPFTDTEELLIVGGDSRLYWVRHANSGDAAGWEQVDLQTPALEVVVLVHPTLVTVAVVLTAQDAGGEQHLRFLRLEQQDGRPAWVLAQTAPIEFAWNLGVQYVLPRGAGAFVTVLCGPEEIRQVWVFRTVLPSDEQPEQLFERAGWRAMPGQYLPRTSKLVIGVDGPLLAPTTVQVYRCDPTGELFRIFYRFDTGEPLLSRIGDGATLAGLYPTVDGTGCVALVRAAAGAPAQILTFIARENDLERSVDLVDADVDSATTWMDLDGRTHVYGLTGDVLRVVHQVSSRWLPSTDVGWRPQAPVWDTMTSGSGRQVALARPIVRDVLRFELDAQPDAYPSQHVMHSSGPAPERCAIYTQDVSTTWWSRENVRLVSEPLPPYTVTRFSARVTLKDAFGGNVGDYPVSVTASAAVEVEVHGSFYRVGPDRPALLRTDWRGQVTIKAIARDLGGVTLTVSAAGLPNAASVNPANDIQRFLGGTGTLPPLPSGISEQALLDARTSDGRFVFQDWHRSDTIPTPADVMTTFRELFRPRTGEARTIVRPDGEVVQAHALVIQAWDPTRPGLQVLTSQEEVAAFRATRLAEPMFGGFWDAAGAWLGDVWQGVKDGLVQVVQAELDLLTGVATISLQWLDDVQIAFDVVCDSAVAAARVAESVVNAVGAAASDVLDWLRWAFDLEDVFATKDALVDGLRMWAGYMSHAVDYGFAQIPPGWFAEQEAKVRAYLEAAVPFCAGTLGPDQAVSIPAQTGQLPEIVSKPQKVDNAHATWMRDQLASTPGSQRIRLAALDEIPTEFTEAHEAFEAMLAVFADPVVGARLKGALDRFCELFTNLFQASDAQTLARTELRTLIEMVGDLVGAVLAFADILLVRLKDFILAMVACVPVILDLEVEGFGLLDRLWWFVCTQAGADPETPLSIGNLFGVAAAFPVTVCLKAGLGSAPFPDGRFPGFRWDPSQARPSTETTWFPAGAEHSLPDEYPIPPRAQAGIQAAVGAATMGFSFVDLYMDTHQPPLPVGTMSEDWQVLLITVYDMLFFGVCDLPVFWGTDNLWKCTTENGSTEWLWWLEYFCKLPIYLGDLFCAVVLPLVSEKGTPSRILGTLQNQVGNDAINALGVFEALASTALLMGSDKKPIDVYWFATQIVSMVSSLTAVVRVLPVFATSPALRAVKMAVDAATDIAAGGAWWMTGCLAVLPDLMKGDLPHGQVGKPYSAQLTASTDKRFPPFGWAVTFGEMPPGVGFKIADADDFFVVEVGGTPLKEGDYYFTITAANSYDPNSVAVKDFHVTIAAADPHGRRVGPDG